MEMWCAYGLLAVCVTRGDLDWGAYLFSYVTGGLLVVHSENIELPDLRGGK